MISDIHPPEIVHFFFLQMKVQIYGPVTDTAQINVSGSVNLLVANLWPYFEIFDRSVSDFMPFRENAISWIPRVRVQGLTVLYPNCVRPNRVITETYCNY